MKAIHCLMLFSALMLFVPVARSAHGQDHAPKTRVSVAPNSASAETSKLEVRSESVMKTAPDERDFWGAEIAWLPTCSALMLMMTAQVASIVQLRRNRKKSYLLSAEAI